MWTDRQAGNGLPDIVEEMTAEMVEEAAKRSNSLLIAQCLTLAGLHAAVCLGRQ